jgi:hypothetical protein
MYEWKGDAVNWADWAVLVEVTNADTNAPLDDIDPDDTELVIELQMQDNTGNVVMNLTTEDDSITIPEIGSFQWRVDLDVMAGLNAGQTYRWAARLTNTGGTTPLVCGSLALDGDFSWQ